MSKRRSQQRGRSKAASVSLRKTFPWAAVLGSTALGVALVAVLAYAVLNAGSAAPNPLSDADNSVPGVVVADTPPSQGHKPGPLKYDQTPSWGGEHNGTWMTCQGNVYDAEVPEENAAHSMEHGAVWVSYRPDLPKDQVTELRDLVEGTDYRLMSPFPGQKASISIQAWGRQLTADSADDPALKKFAQEFTNGPQTPEKGATCSGGVQTTGISDPTDAAPAMS